MNLFEVRIHSRGGQGVLSAAEMLSVAVFLEGNFAQAIPNFGSERMGAPVRAYCRFSDREIRSREPVIEPNALIIQDATLINQAETFAGISDDAWVLINSSRDLEELGIERYIRNISPARICVVDATGLARKHIGKPIPNAGLLGGFAAITGLLKFESVEQAIMQKFSGPVGKGNVKAALEAYSQLVASAEHASA